MNIQTSITISTAHFVHTANPSSKCRRLHGHNWKIFVNVNGNIENDGMVMDYTCIKNVVNKLDHKTLISEELASKKDIDVHDIHVNGKHYVLPVEDCIILPTPSITSENIALYIRDELQKIAPSAKLHVKVYETEGSYAEI